MKQQILDIKDTSLKDFNIGLKELKEEFHRTGRFDDANTKLDEIVKLLLVKFFDLKNGTTHLDENYLKKIAKENFNSEENIASALQYVFAKVADNKIFVNKDGSNVFGQNPRLNIQLTDNKFASKIINIINLIKIDSAGKAGFVDFDILNESFGHFIRDNFRNHKEDAQYMTPTEVVDAMTEMAFSDILKDSVAKADLLSIKKEFIVLDPTCGVGTFIDGAAKYVKKIVLNSNVKDANKVFDLRARTSFFGQDKVDRMVRMAKINALFYGISPVNVVQGNSIVEASILDSMVNKVDLILTNPPFGAQFEIKDLNLENFELLSSIIGNEQVRTVNSELLMMDRCLKLLKPNGRLLIVVPDSVVSSGGLYEKFREVISKKYIVKAILDLPAETFAQAGTRTKCSVVYLQKPQNSFEQKSIFMSVVKELGFEVKEKLGSPVKTYVGHNDLLEIVKAYKLIKNSSGTKILSKDPSAVLFPFKSLIHGKWNANFYNSSRINAVNQIDSFSGSEFEIKTLSDITTLCSKERKRKLATNNSHFISILHINEDNTIKLEEAKRYAPISPGIECFPGEILFSKINPRIPRVSVIPQLEGELICSNEFEILKPNDIKHTYLLKVLLLSDIVQKQINSLTSGTSSSHNRIKSSELAHIKIPWARQGSDLEKKLIKLSQTIKIDEEGKYKLNKNIAETKNQIERLLSTEI